MNDEPPEIVYTKHASEKFEILARHGFPVTTRQVAATLSDPDLVIEQSGGRLLAQKIITERHLLRVVYRLEANRIVVITFYPAYKERYES